MLNTFVNLDYSLILPALIAGMLILLTHVPLGQEVLKRGIIFIDLAVAQVAALGVVAASMLSEGLTLHSPGLVVFGLAAAFAILAALFFKWTEHSWPHLQEAIIGIVFVLSASIAILLLSHQHQNAEHIKALLSGQILWVTLQDLWIHGAIAAGIALGWFKLLPNRQQWFYVLFALAVTSSVQLVGVYLVFASLILPAIFSEQLKHNRFISGFLLGLTAYALGLTGSLVFDLPSGPMIVCALVFTTVLGLILRKYRKKNR